MNAVTPIFLRADQVAQLLDLPGARAFLRQRDRLERDLFFPPPVPVQTKTYRWRANEVRAWIERQGTAPMPLPPRANVVQLRAV